jgi:hypothetical protein
MLNGASHRIAVTGMFNAHHARAALGVIERQPVPLETSYWCPKRRSNDGQVILKADPRGLQLGPDLVLHVELRGLEPLASCMPCKRSTN